LLKPCRHCHHWPGQGQVAEGTIFVLQKKRSTASFPESDTLECKVRRIWMYAAGQPPKGPQNMVETIVCVFYYIKGSLNRELNGTEGVRGPL
jgi:hypothetical protein